MKTLLSLFIAVFFSIGLSAQQWGWSQKSNLPTTARVNTLGFSDGFYGFMALGNTTLNANVLKDCWKYDPHFDQWTRMSDFPGTARKNSFVFVINSKAYVGGGHSGSQYFRDMHVYDMITDQWTTATAYPGNGSRTLFAASCNGKAYVGGGRAGSNFRDFYTYDPATDSWTQLRDLPFGNRASGVAFTIEDTVYFGMGYDGSNGYRDLWGYSVNDSSWSQKASIPGSNRLKATVFVINDQATVGGGFNFNTRNNLSDYYTYNAKINRWDTVATFMAAQRSSATAFAIGNVGFLLAGASPTYLNDVWSYNNIGNVNTNINENSLKLEEVDVYPNPADRQLNIALEGSYRLSLYSLSGRLLLEKRMQSNEPLDVSQFSPGIYLLNIITETDQYQKKLIIDR